MFNLWTELKRGDNTQFESKSIGQQKHTTIQCCHVPVVDESLVFPVINWVFSLSEKFSTNYISLQNKLLLSWLVWQLIILSCLPFYREKYWFDKRGSSSKW
jgi:hypothetical protein